MTALSKALIAEALSDSLSWNRSQAILFIDDFFELIRRALEDGESVKLSGFGNFNLRDKKERPGRNPKTGKPVPVAARRVVTYKPGPKLKHRIEDQ